MTTVLDERSGIGKVLKGSEEIAEVNYTVRVYDKVKSVLESKTPANEMVHLSHVECELSQENPAIPISPLRELTLVMSDGKKLGFKMLETGALVTREVY
jgi:hypothetical protein